MELPKTASGAGIPRAEELRLFPRRWHVEDFGGNDAVGDANLGGQHAVFRDIECADAFGNYPFVGGADGPDLDTGCNKIGDQRGQLREDAGADELVEVLAAAVRSSWSRRPA